MRSGAFRAVPQELRLNTKAYGTIDKSDKPTPTRRNTFLSTFPIGFYFPFRGEESGKVESAVIFSRYRGNIYCIITLNS